MLILGSITISSGTVMTTSYRLKITVHLDNTMGGGNRSSG